MPAVHVGPLEAACDGTVTFRSLTWHLGSWWALPNGQIRPPGDSTLIQGHDIALRRDAGWDRVSHR